MNKQKTICDFHEQNTVIKVNTYGIREIILDWFHSYLTNREQYVWINNVNFNPKIILCGVPQGFILDPLIFFLFINDITKCTNQFKYILYTDDSALSTCIPGDNVMDSAELINNGLNCLNRWLKLN